jgi:hypothetical protein
MEVPEEDLLKLLAVATLYVNAFREDEMMSLTERIRLQEIEDILDRYVRATRALTTWPWHTTCCTGTPSRERDIGAMVLASQQTADAIKEALLKQGIPVSRAYPVEGHIQVELVQESSEGLMPSSREEELYDNVKQGAKNVAQYVLKQDYATLHPNVRRSLMADQILYLAATYDDIPLKELYSKMMLERFE